MEDLKSQRAKTVLILLFLLFIPLIPPSFKPSYLYFLINSLVVVLILRADAGLKTPAVEIRTAAAAAAPPPPPPVIAELNALQEEGRAESDMIAEIADDEKNGIEGEEEDDVDGDLSEEELFTRAEAFIDNFHKQLKMQRIEGGV